MIAAHVAFAEAAESPHETRTSVHVP